ncbi:hypothetical protein Tco_1274718 [Tanacetum coccineum]
MCTYLKNMAGFPYNLLQNKSFDEVRKDFDKTISWIESFVPMDSEVVKDRVDGSETRVEGTEEVAINAIPLATKHAPIVDFQIHTKGKKGYYEIIRTDGSSKIYLVFSQLLKEFDREDLENLWRLVKAKHGNTRPKEAYERMLWSDLKVMVHFVRFQNIHIYMLVEKTYPLTPTTITDMLNRKLQAEDWNEMYYELAARLQAEEQGELTIEERGFTSSSANHVCRRRGASKLFICKEEDHLFFISLEIWVGWPEDKLRRVSRKCLRIMFEEPLSTDSIWSEIEQQKIVSWRYYDTSRVHCLNLESMDVYLLSDRKYPLPAEDDYDTWAMEMEHYLEYIDNEVWKVIQNGNSKKRVTKGKDGVYRAFSLAWIDAKEIWEAIKTRFGGNANSKKMQKAVLKQQFEAFTISSKESLEKGYDRFQKLLSQLDALGAGVSDEDANHKFLSQSLFQASIRHSTAQEVIVLIPLPLPKKIKRRKVDVSIAINTGHFARESKLKALRKVEGRSREWYPMCSKLCLDSYNALQAKYDELQSEFGDQEAALVAHKLAVKKLESQLKASHKQQSSLTEKLNFQANQIFEKDEKLKNSTVKIGLGYGIKSNAEVLGYEEEISNGNFSSLGITDAGYHDIPLYSLVLLDLTTGKQHVNSGRMYVNSGTQNKSGGSRVNTGKQNVNSGRVHVNTARVNRPVLSNQTSQVNLKSPKKCFSKQSSPVNRPFSRNTAYKSNYIWLLRAKWALLSQGSRPKPVRHGVPKRKNLILVGHLEEYQDTLSKVGSVTFGGSKGSISGKGYECPSSTQKLLLSFVLATKPILRTRFKRFIDIDVQTAEDADLMWFFSSLSEKIATKKDSLPRQPSSTPIPSLLMDIMLLRRTWMLSALEAIKTKRGRCLLQIHSNGFIMLSSKSILGRSNTPVQTSKLLQEITEAHALEKSQKPLRWKAGLRLRQEGTVQSSFNKYGLGAQGLTTRSRIDYDEVFCAPCRRIEAIRHPPGLLILISYKAFISGQSLVMDCHQAPRAWYALCQHPKRSMD